MGTTIAGISSMATRLILAELAGRYEAATGVKASIQSMGGVDAAKKVREGEQTDIVILASGPMDQLEKDGHLVAGSVKRFTRSKMAIAVPRSVKAPDLDSEEAVRAAVLQADRICYSTGPSGDHVLKLCAEWGIPPTSRRLLRAPPGVPVASLVARGEADLGFQQLSELIGVRGIRVVYMPDEIQNVTVFAAGVATTSKQPEAAAALIAYLTSPETAEVKQAQGMEPD